MRAPGFLASAQMMVIGGKRPTGRQMCRRYKNYFSVTRMRSQS